MNRATRIIVATFGVILAIAGMNHGFFEILQGNTPTDGLVIQAIGPEHQMWAYGGEEAFTIVPNFLATGILAMAVGLAIIVWSLAFVHKPRGPLVFILLFVALFLVGGGIGQVVFFVPTWIAAIHINKPLTRWRKVLPEKRRRTLANLWPASLSLASLLFIIALEIAIFGFVPGMSDPDRILIVCWSCLLAGWVLLLFSFVAGFADDIQYREAGDDGR